MRKKQMVSTKRKRLKDKESQDMLTIKLLSLIDKLHTAQGSVNLSKLEEMLNETTDSVKEGHNERT